MLQMTKDGTGIYILFLKLTFVSLFCLTIVLYTI